MVDLSHKDLSMSLYGEKKKKLKSKFVESGTAVVSTVDGLKPHSKRQIETITKRKRKPEQRLPMPTCPVKGAPLSSNFTMEGIAPREIKYCA